MSSQVFGVIMRKFTTKVVKGKVVRVLGKRQLSLVLEDHIVNLHKVNNNEPFVFDPKSAAPDLEFWNSNTGEPASEVVAETEIYIQGRQGMYEQARATFFSIDRK